MDTTFFIRCFKRFLKLFVIAAILMNLIIYYYNLWTPSHVFIKRSESSDNMSFINSMKLIPWTSYKVKVDEKSDFDVYSTGLLHRLIPFLTREPLIAINETCQKPISVMPSGCIPLKTPRKVGILWQFGFDVDILEIHLNELDDFVDKFFITESTRAHNKRIASKPLLWNKLKDTKRFSRFSEKVVHFCLEEFSFSKDDMADIWFIEKIQEVFRWAKFLEWNNATNYFGKDDLLGFGDVDELPFWENVFFLKHCELPSDPVDIGIWFPFDGLDTVFRSNFPVDSLHPFTFGDPSFWTLGTATEYYKNTGNVPNRMRGKSEKYLLGGAHLSRYAYPPLQMVKMLTSTESNWDSLQVLIEVGMMYADNKTEEAEIKLNECPEHLLKRIKKLDEFKETNPEEVDSIVKMPWFLQCNMKRYPGFDKRHDLRLDVRS